jgi:hypothetical protein
MSARRPRNVVDLPSRPVAYVAGSGETASIIDANVRLMDQRCEAFAAVCFREMELKIDLIKARKERQRMTRQINRLYRMRVQAGLAVGPAQPAIDEAGSPR